MNEKNYQSGPQPTPQMETSQPVMQPAPVYQPGQTYGQPAPVAGLPANANNDSQWKADLCDCSPFESCLLSTFFPCILAGRTADRLRDPSMETADSCNADCMCLCAIEVCTGCGWIYVMMKRGEIRERFGIEGGGCEDCCVTYWLPCCALIQQDNEVAARLRPAVPVQGYQSQAPMQMQMPNGQ